MQPQNLNNFLNLVRNESSLLDKVKACNSPDELVAIALEAGISLSPDDFSKTDFSVAELSNEELEKVAGGIFPIAGAIVARQLTVKFVCDIKGIEGPVPGGGNLKVDFK